MTTAGRTYRITVGGEVPPLAPPTVVLTGISVVGAATSSLNSVVRNVNSGSLLPGNASYPIPIDGTVVRYVAPYGNDTTGTGLIGAPWATVQHAINATGVGAYIVLRQNLNGTPWLIHEGGAPGSSASTGVTVGAGHENITIANYPGEAVYFDGSSVFTGWSADTTLGRTIWTTPYTVGLDRSVQFATGSIDGSTPWLPTSGPGMIANWFDQGWLLDSTTGRELVRLTQVATKAEVVPGTFWVQGSGNAGQVFNPTAVFIGNNPAAFTIRFGDLVTAVGLLADGAGMKGVGVQRYVGMNGDGCVKLRRNGNWLENVWIDDPGGVGVDLYLNTRVGPLTLNRVTVRRGGLNGLHALQADNVTITNSVFELNNISQWNMAPAAAGVKMTSCMHIVITGTKFLNNYADGYWCDASCYDCNLGIIDGIGNAGTGLEFELSAVILIADAFITNSGKGDILIRCSDAARLWNVTATDCGQVNMDVTQDNRRPDGSVPGQDPRHSSPTDPVYGTVGMKWVIQNVEIKNSVLPRPAVAQTGGALRIRSQETVSKPYTAMNPLVDGNLYCRPSSGSPATGWALSSAVSGAVGYSTFAAYQAATVTAGQPLDVHSTDVEGHDVLNPNYTVAPADYTAAVGGVIPLPTDVAALIGRAPGDVQLGAYMGQLIVPVLRLGDVAAVSTAAGSATATTTHSSGAALAVAGVGAATGTVAHSSGAAHAATGVGSAVGVAANTTVTYISDTFTGANNAAWSGSWVQALATTGAAAYLTSNQGRLDTGNVTGHVAHMNMRYAGGSVADTEFTGQFTFFNSATIDGYWSLAARTDSALNLNNGYMVQVVPQSGIAQVLVIVGGVETQLGTNIVHTFSDGAAWSYRFRVVGTTIQFRLWQGTEPGTWDVSVTNSGITGAGYFGINANGGNIAGFAVDNDNVTVTGGVAGPPGAAFTATGVGAAAGTVPGGSGVWASGVSMYGLDIPAWSTWRGTPTTHMTTWADDTANHSLNCSQFDNGSEYYNWTGSGNFAPGGIWSSPTDGAVSSWAAAASGASDTFWSNCLTNLKNKWTRISRGTLYIRFAHEMNGNWYPWSVSSGDAANFIAAWRRYYNLKQSIFPAAKLAFATNGEGLQGFNWATNTWPGDAYVDVYDVDWYSNHWLGCGSTTGALLDGTGAPRGLSSHLTFAGTHGKAMGIGEWAVNASSGDVPNYVQQMHDFFVANAGPGSGKLTYEAYYNISTFQVYPDATGHPNAAAKYQSLF